MLDIATIRGAYLDATEKAYDQIERNIDNAKKKEIKRSEIMQKKMTIEEEIENLAKWKTAHKCDLQIKIKGTVIKDDPQNRSFFKSLSELIPPKEMMILHLGIAETFIPDQTLLVK
ncbi:Oidioi.mRNA.OKI2018_I69.PAR.g11969.t1.cds [Oikopleura dioica]|uniref:Oidioi.mRNA.OKI2018_I69.PAR.g11969.t1.cds n=1 Tax=Oikopleura dioica TaxID=34765 RepID=A0ABN7RY71_OIKDI|nr:Oidioi.mRNA.OKI2018_I69.PAR.g11969.t1.cds [Oikopleura dioica]